MAASDDNDIIRTVTIISTSVELWSVNVSLLTLSADPSQWQMRASVSVLSEVVIQRRQRLATLQIQQGAWLREIIGNKPRH